MRFFSDGPNIPDNLLKQQAEGQVVFVCGAGVSVDSGMPSADDLAKYVIHKLHAVDNPEISEEIKPWCCDGSKAGKIPLDRVFGLLDREYGREKVRQLVTDRLSASNCASGNQQHRNLLTISSNKERKPQIVTTNFDRLFEREYAFSERGIFQPPTLPDMRANAPITGITYLHGRLGETEHDYILSGKDFGRAYLGEGWATQFLRSLLMTYTVVLIGYRAAEPLVEYLLEGLGRKDNSASKSDDIKLYAFDKEEDEVQSKWNEKRVKVIAYKDHDGTYSILWKTIDAWARRITNPEQWNEGVISIARKGPREVAPYQRDQVAHLIDANAGAAAFSSADPPLPAEWLCVFDVDCRLPKNPLCAGGGQVFKYALECETPESINKITSKPPHFLGWRSGDGITSDAMSLNRFAYGGASELPTRQEHLIKWIVKSMDSPVTAWWVALTPHVHPRLLALLRSRLLLPVDAGILLVDSRRIWNLILEYRNDPRGADWNEVWCGIEDRVKKENGVWTEDAIRLFDKDAAPIFKPFSQLCPYTNDLAELTWENFLPGHIMGWEVRFPDQGELEIPDETLSRIFKIAERHFIQFAGFAKNFGFQWSACSSARSSVEDAYRYQLEKNSKVRFEWFLGLFQQMLKYDKALLEDHMSTWPNDELLFFGRLRLRALSEKELFPAGEFGTAVCSLSDKQFWCYYHRRQLLLLIKSRWDDFFEETKINLINRILAGRETESGLSKEGRRNNKMDSIDCIKWMQKEGMSFPNEERVERTLEEMIAETGWKDDRVEDLTNFGYLKPISSGTAADPEVLVNIPPEQVIRRSKEIMQSVGGFSIENHPFGGLVNKYPCRALDALAACPRDEKGLCGFWEMLFQKWPRKYDNSELYRKLLVQIKILSNKLIRGTNHAIAGWIEKHFKNIFVLDEGLAWKIFDRVLDGLVSDDGSATVAGGIFPGQTHDHLCRPIRRTSKGPIGDVMSGCLSALKIAMGTPPSGQQGIPENFKRRMERLLESPGDGRAQAVAEVSRELNDIYDLDSGWVKSRVAPEFDFQKPTAHAAWSNYLLKVGSSLLNADILHVDALFAFLKPSFVDFMTSRRVRYLKPSSEEIATQIAVHLFIYRKNQPRGLTEREARNIIRSISEPGRKTAISNLVKIGCEGRGAWSNRVVPFVTRVWPLEERYKTPPIVSSWIDLLSRTSDAFPKVYEAVQCLLKPIYSIPPKLNFFLRKARSRTGCRRPLIKKHPDLILCFLDRIIPDEPGGVIPNELVRTLKLIKKSDKKLGNERSFLRLTDLTRNQ